MLRKKKAVIAEHSSCRQTFGKNIDKRDLTKILMWTSRTSLVFTFLLLSFASLRMQIAYVSRNTATADGNSYDSTVTTSLRIHEKVENDEFFHKSPQLFSLQNHLNFTPPDLSANKNRLKLNRMWKCEDDPATRKKKVVYLHMSRSAGATFRPFFRAYSRVCHRGIAFVSGCVDLGIESTSGSDQWQNGELSPYAARECYLSTATSPEGDDIEPQVKGHVSSKFLRENNFDLIGGHLPIGSHATWTDQQTLYVIMIREPLARFVSEMIYRYGSERMSIQDLTTLVNRTTTSRLEMNHYRDSYSCYFITPEQMKWADIENIDLTTETRMNLALHNLYSGNILLGLVERIPQSLEMIQYALDESHHAESLFNYFASPTEIDSVVKRSNKTESVLRAIGNDAILSANLQELLKYELTFHYYAQQLHETQYKWMQEDISVTME